LQYKTIIVMNEKTLYKTNDFVSFIQKSGISVSIDKAPDSSTIERIKKLIAKKRAFFEFQKSLFN